MALAAAAGERRGWVLLAWTDVFRLQPAEDPRRRLVPPGGGGRGLFPDGTWSRGRQLLAKRREDTFPLVEFVNQLRTKIRAGAGDGRFPDRPGPETSPMLMHHLKHNRVLNEQVIVLTVVTQDVPRVPTGK